MALNMIIEYGMKVIKPIKLTADPHLENIEVVHLDLGKGAPDVQIVLEFKKNEGRC